MSLSCKERLGRKVMRRVDLAARVHIYTANVRTRSTNHSADTSNDDRPLGPSPYTGTDIRA